ncbi:MAG: hypothetical protein M0036_19045 [Desulfobacteraceae bacterium]|nr:hypothetical protein [Desulfobacteraceae bacterium]
MGWLYTYKPENQSVMQFFKEHFDHETALKKGEVLDCAVVNMRTAYIAYRVTHKDTGRTFVLGVICLINYSRDRYNFGYKDMEEFCGPCEAQCPERILKQLSPLDQIEPHYGTSYEWACAWRERCRENIKNRKRLTELNIGNVIKFREPIKFSNGIERDTLRLAAKGRGKGSLIFEDLDGYGRFRVSRNFMANRNFMVR